MGEGTSWVEPESWHSWGVMGLPGVKGTGLGVQKDHGARPWADGHAGGERMALLWGFLSKGWGWKSGS